MSVRIFAKHPVIKSINDFKNNIKRNTRFLNISENEYLDRLIKWETGDIINSTEIIEREKQRIKKAKKNVRIIFSVMTEKSSKECKFVLRKAYKDLQEYAISDSKSKIKE